MNCTDLFVKKVQENAAKTALFIPKMSVFGRLTSSEVSFGELYELTSKAYQTLKGLHLNPGDQVLVVEPLGVRLYAWAIALLARGCGLILVEPWMPVSKIEHAIQISNPKVFISSPVGFAWGARVAAIRKIRKWHSSRALDSASPRSFQPISVDPHSPGILTFTSGTSGKPKGVVRTQGYLLKQHEVLSTHLEADQHPGPDLCIFANFVFSNLASARGSIVIPSGWAPEILASLDDLPERLRPETLTCGPGFLLELMKNSKAKNLKSIHVGGALTDCQIFEQAFEKWPDTEFHHLYGGSEVEPVAIAEARRAVENSKKRGLFQTLNIGKAVPEIQTDFEKDSLWVSGPHVCGEYLGNPKENQTLKKKDAQGRSWHCMGDRIQNDDQGLWYSGRSQQSLDEFQMEQEIYSFVGSSKSFIQNIEGSYHLIGEGISHRSIPIRRRFPKIEAIHEAKIYRDPRHRARIDRNKTLNKGAKWLLH